jgi:hypothetical protein
MKLVTRLATAALLVGAVILPSQKGLAQVNAEAQSTTQSTQDHPYVGMWVTEDGHVRQELLPNGRYDEARGTRRSAYQGRYEVRGDDIFYWDDTGFTADGRFVDDVLHHGDMIFYREE